MNAASKTDLRGWRDGALIGLLLGCTLRRSEVVGLTLDQVQTRDGRWVIVDLVGKGRRLRTVPVPSWSKQLLDVWLQCSGVSEVESIQTEFSKQGKRQEAGVTCNVVWYAVKRCASQAGIDNLAPHDLRRTARLCHDYSGELKQIRFLLGHASVQTTSATSGANRSYRTRLMIGSAFRRKASPHKPPPLSRPHNGDSVLYHSLLGFGKRRRSLLGACPKWRL